MSAETPFFQVGVIVTELERAMDELTRSVGIEWGQVRARPRGGRLVFSLTGPPHIELIESVRGTYWDAGGGARIDHLGFWSDDYGADRERLIRCGFPVVVDGPGLSGRPFSYHATQTAGMRLELLSASMRPEFLARWT